MTRDLGALQTITQTVLDMKMRVLADIKADEDRLYAELATLDEQSKQPDMAMKLAGADILWGAWVGRKRADIQMKLARLRVKKEAAIADIRNAFGRNNVMRQIALADEEQRRVERARSEHS